MLALEALSTPRNRTRTLILLAACGIAAAGAAAIGVSDNPPGILLAFLAAAAFVLAFVHPWRTERQFGFLAGGSVLGLVCFAILSEALEGAAKSWVHQGLLRSVLEVLAGTAFLLAVVVCPPTFLVGTVGAVAMHIRDRRRSKQDNDTAATDRSRPS